MLKVITITGTVNGTGKTSLLANLATVLTEDFGKRVLCIGLAPDLQDWLLMPPSTNYSLRALGLPTMQPTHAAVQTQKNMPDYLLLGESELEAIQALEQVPLRQRHYDYVLIEAKSEAGWTGEVAFFDADLVLIAGGLNRFETLEQQRRLVAKLSQLLRANRWEPVPIRTVLSVPVPRTTGEEEYMTPAQLRELETHYNDTYRQPDLPPVCATQIIADEEYEESLCVCRPVAHTYPNSRTVQDYRALAQELLTILHDH